MEGYVSSLSPIKLSRKTKRPYFDMDLQTSNGKKRAVCFCKDRYRIFKELDESGDQGCVILSYDQGDNDIIINDSSKVSKSALNFQRSKEIKYFDINSIINEFSLYTRVNIKGKTTDLSIPTESEVKGTMMAIKTAIIHDQSGFAPITFFGDILCDTLENDKCYDFQNLSLSKYRSDRILKTTEITKFVEIDDLQINTEGRATNSNIIKRGKIVLVNSKSLIIKYKCPECKNDIRIEEDFATCDSCDIFTVKSLCVKDDKVSCVFQSDVKERLALMVPIDMLKEITEQNIDNKNQFMQSLMTKTLTAQYDPNDMVVRLLTNTEE